ncbi:MAG: SRPBCC domain-containing protein [Actinobacteria bacterium]|jgi:uncharacterized protein YndB with AHSA1/START domain|uniref:Unannotated protein n=1 Tax=freshwater metagenome TaxID=449393 RepID=A0A6J6JYD8_9ZZZZ|nr:SRPBCC domain-containing protein [Actinomycetota bacterium]
MPEPFRISHVVKAPIGVVWNAWTREEELLQWWGPAGLEMSYCAADVKPGGKFHYLMTNEPDANETFEMWGAFDYLEVEPQQRIVFVNYFSDENGGKTRHSMNPDWPLEVKSILTFVEDGDQTLLHLEGAPINAAPHEEELYFQNLESMRIGFGGTFAQLDEHLANALEN